MTIAAHAIGTVEHSQDRAGSLMRWRSPAVRLRAHRAPQGSVESLEADGLERVRCRVPTPWGYATYRTALQPNKAVGFVVDAKVYALTVTVRMRRLLAATPELPPDYPHLGELVGNQTLAERYLQDLAAWRRRYLCNARPSRPA
jgi:hypothetical protein